MNSNLVLTLVFTICTCTSIFQSTIRYSASARKLFQAEYDVTIIRNATVLAGVTRSMCATKQGSVFVLANIAPDSIYIIDSSTDIGTTETVSEIGNTENPWTQCITVDEVAYILPDNAGYYVTCRNENGSYECEAHELAYKITDCVKTDLGAIYCICGTCDKLIEFQTTNTSLTTTQIGLDLSQYSKSVWVPHQNSMLIMPSSMNTAFVLINLDTPAFRPAIQGYSTVQSDEFNAMAYHDQVQRVYVVSIKSTAIGVIDVNQLMYYSIQTPSDGDLNVQSFFADVVVARNGLVYCAPYNSNSALILHPNGTNAGEEVYEILQVLFNSYIKIIDTDIQKLYMLAPQYGVTIIDYSDSSYTLNNIILVEYGAGWSSIVFSPPDSMYVGTVGSPLLVRIEYQDPEQPEPSSSPQSSTQPQSSSSPQSSTQPQSSSSPQSSTQPQSSSSPQSSTQPEPPEPSPSTKESGAQFARRTMKTVSKRSRMCQNTNFKHTHNETVSTLVSF